ncbi:hypothetical protein [Nitrosomonas sp.]|uniref:hypothetical protein n=1 Tax=Nitrosomonas sp. TaxID=42353 RepID=UPI0025DDE5F6|nr:hypothetical protein [Nitrosomonas sp.]
MNALKSYLNSLEPEKQEQFATKCGTTVGYMRKIICSKGELFFGPVISRKIEEYSGGKVSRIDLRPHDWRDHWPELEGKTGISA